MNRFKFSLADVLTVLIALLFGYVCFLSTYFFTLGKTRQSIILSVIIFVLLCGTALGAKVLKRTGGNFKTRFISEMTLLILFTGFTFYFSYSPFSHYFVVSAQKEEIQRKLNASITQAENMFTEYEHYTGKREGLYKDKLNSVVAAKDINQSEYDSYGFVNNNVSNEKQIANKIRTLHIDLFPSNYYSDSISVGIKDGATTWLADAKDKIAGWKPLGVVIVVNEVEQHSTEWYNTLTGLSKVREKGEQADDFADHLSFDDVKKHFITLGRTTSLSIGLAVAAYLLMLLSYLITKRSTKTNIGTSKKKGKFDINY